MQRVPGSLFASLVLWLFFFPVNALSVPPEPLRLPASAKPLGSLVYIVKGDLYTRDLPNGPVRRLTTDGGNSAPQWSPSGKWIAFYHSDSPNYSGMPQLIRNDGSDRRSVDGSVAPIRGEFVILPPSDHVEITSLDTGKTQPVVVAPVNYSVGGVAWSPDGRSLAYTIHHDGGYENDGKTESNVSLCRINADGTGKPDVLYTSKGHRAVPVIAQWSPDSRYLLFWALHLSPGASVNMDGVPLYSCSPASPSSPAHRLFGKKYTDEVLAESESIDFQPQSHHAAISVGGSRFRAEHKRMALLDLKRGSYRFVTPANTAAICPIWSPDGKRIAYFSGPAATENRLNETSGFRLSMMNADGTHQQRLESGPVACNKRPHWLSDNQHVLFERISPGKERDIKSLWMMDLSSKRLTCIVPLISNIAEDWRGADFDAFLPSTKRPAGTVH